MRGEGFTDRAHAGRELAGRLAPYRGRSDVLVLALPRGGVPVGFEVAEALSAPLDVFVVRKLGVPGHEELAMGAIASGGVRVVNDDVVGRLGVPAGSIAEVVEREQGELERREHAYRGGREPPDLEGKVVILVDDGLATGATMLAAVRAARRLGPARVVVATPVAAPPTCAMLAREADEVVSVMTPDPMHAISLWYRDFPQTPDDEVRDLLERAGDGPGEAKRQ